MAGAQISRNELILSVLCNYRGLDPTKFLGDVSQNDVKSLYINILTASGVGVSVKLNDEVSKWLSFADNFCVTDLGRLNEELVHKSVLFGNGPKASEIDLIVFSAICSSVIELSNSEREKFPHVMTWMHNIQLQLKRQENAAMVEANTNPIAYANGTGNNCYWQWEEDKLLISAWLNVSKDPSVDTDQTGDSFWNRIRLYCEESHPDLIKRGINAIKKRWHRINKGAQAFGGCHDEATCKISNSSNYNNILELAHNLFQAKYKKKCNFDRHWHELLKEQKWRSQFVEIGDSKRMKMNASGAYSSSSNSKTETGEATPMDSPVGLTVDPQCTEAAKRNNKGKLKESESGHTLAANTRALKPVTAKKLSLMSEINRIKEKEIDMQLLYADTSKMSEVQREIHAKLLEKFKEKYL